jgi:predicted GNAT family N-acyltransferase
MTLCNGQALAGAHIPTLVPLRGNREAAAERLDATTLRAVTRASITGAGRLVVIDSAPDASPGQGTEPNGILGRLAAGKAARSTGLGRLLVDAIEQREAERWLAAVELHALTHARSFYQQLSYAAYGDLFSEAGIEHISTRKELR